MHHAVLPELSCTKQESSTVLSGSYRSASCRGAMRTKSPSCVALLPPVVAQSPPLPLCRLRSPGRRHQARFASVQVAGLVAVAGCRPGRVRLICDTSGGARQGNRSARPTVVHSPFVHQVNVRILTEQTFRLSAMSSNALPHCHFQTHRGAFPSGSVTFRGRVPGVAPARQCRRCSKNGRRGGAEPCPQ